MHFNLRITRFKLFIAKVLYFIVKIFYKNDIQLIVRDGIKFEVDLREGIDLHLFIFGSFQKHVYENNYIQFKEKDVVFDVGANFGLMTLFFASMVKNGHVHAFEPTNYALKKFHRNIDLNPNLKPNITINHTFISSSSKKSTNINAYSSWPLTGSQTTHEIHGGVLQNTTDIPSITIDDYCEQNQINKLDFIKIDTDGHELDVLNGAEKSIQKFRPQIIFELGIYVMNERGINFEDYSDFFGSVKYKLLTTKGQEITTSNYQKHVYKYGTIDIIAIPA